MVSAGNKTKRLSSVNHTTKNNSSPLYKERIPERLKSKRSAWGENNFIEYLPEVHSKPGQLYLKRNSGTGVFLWILRNF